MTRAKTKFEVPFHRPTQRYRKMIRGRYVHFSSAGEFTKTDKRGKQIVLERLHKHQAELAEKRNASLQTDALGELLWRLENDQLDNEYVSRNLPSLTPEKLRAGMIEMLDEFRATLVPGSTAPKKGLTISEVAAKFLQAQQQRHDEYLIGDARLTNLNTSVKSFVDFSAGRCFGEADNGENEALLNEYRTRLTALVKNETITSHTFNDRIGDLKQFIEWAFGNWHLPSLPRNLKEACRRVSCDPSPNPLTLDEVRRLWTHANQQVRCFMAC